MAHAAAFSFYPSKNLGALGDGGAVVTDDDELAAAARRLRNHGTVAPWVHAEAGYNSRLDELQAAALGVMLPHLDAWTRRRRRVARDYWEAGLGELVKLPSETSGAEASYHLFVAMTPERDELAGALTAADIEARPYFTTPLNRQPGMAGYAASVPVPNAERLAAEGLALPMGPALDRESVEVVVDAVRRTLAT